MHLFSSKEVLIWHILPSSQRRLMIYLYIYSLAIAGDENRDNVQRKGKARWGKQNRTELLEAASLFSYQPLLLWVHQSKPRIEVPVLCAMQGAVDAEQLLPWCALQLTHFWLSVQKNALSGKMLLSHVSLPINCLCSPSVAMPLRVRYTSPICSRSYSYLPRSQ